MLMRRSVLLPSGDPGQVISPQHLSMPYFLSCKLWIPHRLGGAVVCRRGSEKSPNMLRDTQQGTEGHTRARLTPNPCPALSASPPLLVWETLRLGKEKWHPTRGRARMSMAQPHSACPSWSKPLEREAPAQSPRAGLYSRPLLLGSVLFLSPPFLLLPSSTLLCWHCPPSHAEAHR